MKNLEKKANRFPVAFFGAALLLSMAAVLAFSAAPEIMTYQGRLKSSGVPYNGSRQLDFAICPDAGCSAGCMASPSGAQNIHVANGLFRATFSVTGIDITGGDRWLKVYVQGTPLTPCEQLTSSPYAVHAQTAAAGTSTFMVDTLDTVLEDIVISSHVMVEGRLDVEAPAIPGASEQILMARVADDPVSYFGITNGTGGDNWFVPSISGLTARADYVGLSLHARIEDTDDTSAFPIMQFMSTTWDGSNDHLPSNRHLFRFTKNHQSLGQIPVMEFNQYGWVGIGTTLPQATLHVSSATTSSATELLRVSSGTDTSQRVVIVNGDGLWANGQITMGNDTVAPGAASMKKLGSAVELHIRPAPGSNGFLTFTENTIADRWVMGIEGGDPDLIFGTGDSASYTERIRIDDNGDVGIGTTNTSQRLVVNQAGANLRAMFMSDQDYAQLDLYTSGVTERAAVVLDGSGPNALLKLRVGSNPTSDTNTRMTISDTGNVGIATTDAVSTVTVQGALTWVSNPEPMTGFGASKGTVYYDPGYQKLMVNENGMGWKPMVSDVPYRYLERTRPGAGNYVEIGYYDVPSGNGAVVFDISIAISEPTYTVAKSFIVPATKCDGANCNNSTWYRVSPAAISDDNTGEDFGLEVMTNGTGRFYLRIRNTVGSTAGTFGVHIMEQGRMGSTFTPQSGTGGGAYTYRWPSNLITQYRGDMYLNSRPGTQDGAVKIFVTITGAAATTCSTECQNADLSAVCLGAWDAGTNVTCGTSVGNPNPRCLCAAFGK